MAPGGAGRSGVLAIPLPTPFKLSLALRLVLQNPKGVCELAWIVQTAQLWCRGRGPLCGPSWLCPSMGPQSRWDPHTKFQPSAV